MSTQPAPEELLARFPGPVVLTRSPRKWLFNLGIGTLFVVIGVLLVWGGSSSNLNAYIGWFVILFFGLFGFISAISLLPGAGRLALDRHGFTTRSAFLRRRMEWADVSGFEVQDFGGPFRVGQFVAFEYRGRKKTRLVYITGQVTLALARSTTALPDTYALAAEDLARLMIGWRERALKESTAKA